MPDETQSKKNEHATVELPEATSYGLTGRWYVEIRVPHPTDSEMPPCSMTKDVDSRWWAEFLCSLVNNMTDEQWEHFINDKERAPFND